ncbi:hypothetical protein BV898_09935 [Hypsibius exemplaris]|uniref:Uncharacterized protein n=1 Tax=Hypsibius exemplaris TaxID=2072580 RepID=A0A1W0WKU6_HYPEX|nr:hypothetical protein BV898_09935 [Hypsibius exemplaris]
MASHPSKRLQPFLGPLTVLGIVPQEPQIITSSFMKMKWRPFPIVICLVMWLGSLYSLLAIFHCSYSKEVAAHHVIQAGFLNLIENLRRNLQIFAGAFTVCLFCWKGQRIPDLLVRAQELFNDSAVPQQHSPLMGAYFVWVIGSNVLVAASVAVIIPTRQVEEGMICFGVDLSAWRIADMWIKVLETGLSTYLTGILCGVMLLLYDGCRVFQRKIEAFPAEKGASLQELRRWQEILIAFSEECSALFSVVHLLVLADIISMFIVLINETVAMGPESSPRDRCLLEGVALLRNQTLSPAPANYVGSQALFLRAVALVFQWGEHAQFLTAFLALTLCNLVLQSTNHAIVRQLETLESQYAVGSITADPRSESTAIAEFASLLDRGRRRPITLPLAHGLDLSVIILFNIVAGLYAYYSFALTSSEQLQYKEEEVRFRNQILNATMQCCSNDL